eukprot:TRINITY_DN34359_c0_g2_i1.p1 TRINITY_DN34359_c0_g2~~TRINITY_DN34359_c0_g2_i1.p1  ORF type:complete len:130 (+),score=46.85 TRINITY_DN34359_c0_g2_i1:97-486(+)
MCIRDSPDPDPAPPELIDQITQTKAEPNQAPDLAVAHALWPVWLNLSAFLCSLQDSFTATWNEESLLKTALSSRLLILLEAFCVGSTLSSGSADANADPHPAPPALARQSSLATAELVSNAPSPLQVPV